MVFGYKTQNVLGVNVPVVTGSRLCGYSLPYNGGGCDTDVLLSNAATQAGFPVTTFNGKYANSEFTLSASGACAGASSAAPTSNECNIVPSGNVISGGSTTSYTWYTADEVTLHVLAMYEPVSRNADSVEVNFDLPGKHALVLSSYEAANWKIVRGDNAGTIEKIVVFGYKAQTVINAASTPVEINCYECTPRSSGPFCGLNYPYTGGLFFLFDV